VGGVYGLCGSSTHACRFLEASFPESLIIESTNLVHQGFSTSDGSEQHCLTLFRLRSAFSEDSFLQTKTVVRSVILGFIATIIIRGSSFLSNDPSGRTTHTPTSILSYQAIGTAFVVDVVLLDVRQGNPVKFPLTVSLVVIMYHVQGRNAPNFRFEHYFLS